MGIRQLQTYMIKYVPNGYVDVSIIEECQNFERKKKERPVIVVDLMALVRVTLQDKYDEILCGGRHNLYYVFLEKLLQKLASHADLIFFKDGPVVNEKYHTWIKRQDDKYRTSMEIIDKIYAHWPLDEIIRTSRDIPTMTTQLMMIEILAKKYGKYFISIERECDTEIALYAYNTPNVIAILADDTDFLIFKSGPNNWKYLSLYQLDPITLRTKEYNRKALRDYLNLNDMGLSIMSTLGGNDIIQFEEVVGFQKSLVGPRNDCAQRFPALAAFINNLPIRFDALINAIARRVFRNTNESTLKKIVDSFDFYDLDSNSHLPVQQDPLLKYCNEQCYDFTASILNGSIKNFTVSYCDLRILEPNIHSVKVKLFQKQIGIVLMTEKNVNFYKIVSKISHQDCHRQLHVEPIYPVGNFPPFSEILKREIYPQHDDIRFRLIEWTISESLQNFNLKGIPANYLADIAVLTFLVVENFITTLEADIILLSIKHVEIKIVPDELKPPKILNVRAFRIAFLFTKFHLMIKRSFEITGMKILTKVLNFDGVLFHDLYLKHLAHPFNTKLLLGELAHYCCYH